MDEGRDAFVHYLVLFGIGVLAIKFRLWQRGKTEVARAFVVPMSIVGGAALEAGVRIFFPPKARVGISLTPMLRMLER